VDVPRGLVAGVAMWAACLRMLVNLVTAASISSRVLSFHSPFTWLLISDLYLCQSVRELWSLSVGLLVKSVVLRVVMIGVCSDDKS